MTMRFSHRHEAGKALARALASYRDTPDLLVLALPRGGVPVAWEVARALGAELDLLLVRKLGIPGQPEVAMGAIASGGARVLNQRLIAMVGLSTLQVEAVARREQAELERRETAYRGDRPPPRVKDRTVIIVDDGVATGATMEVAIKALRSLAPAHIVVAVPVAPPDTVKRLAAQADDIVCLSEPVDFGAVGQFYVDFGQTSDEEVRDLLARMEAKTKGDMS